MFIATIMASYVHVDSYMVQKSVRRFFWNFHLLSLLLLVMMPCSDADIRVLRWLGGTLMAIHLEDIILSMLRQAVSHFQVAVS